MVRLRLWRGGKKKQPVYRIVAIHSTTARNGKYIEAIGQYNPGVHPMTIGVDEDRLFHWLKRGAQPTDTVRSLLRREGLWMKWGMMKKGADEVSIATALEQWQTLREEKSRRESERKARRKAAKKKAAAAEAAPVPGGAAGEAAEAPIPASETAAVETPAVNTAAAEAPAGDKKAADVPAPEPEGKAREKKAADAPASKSEGKAEAAPGS